MEVENHLFEIKDTKGVFVWDIVRYRVFLNLQWKDKGSKSITKTNIAKKVSLTAANITNFIWAILQRKEYFFFLCSRNKQKDTGRNFDQNAFDTLGLLPKYKCIINESFVDSSNFIYDDYTTIRNTNLILRLFRKKYDLYDYTEIINIVKKYFPDMSLTQEQLNSEYMRFWEEYRYYRFLFRITGAKLVFVTQSRILKGLYYAARSLDLRTIEFNHGIVFDGHMAYSYPAGIKCTNYNANVIFSLSHFWFRDMYLPNTSVIPVGNTYFYPNINENSNNIDTHSILVVSSNVMGVLLKDFVIKSIENHPELLEYHFYFKLHPNQFKEKEEYEGYFENYKNVSVVSTEKSVPEYLSFCETLFTIQSTAAFEALQIGRKVIILKAFSYETMQVLFGEPNIYTIDSTDEFVTCLQKDNERRSHEYFEKFNATVALNMINYLKKK